MSVQMRTMLDVADNSHDLAPAVTVSSETETLAEDFTCGLVWESPCYKLLVHEHYGRTLLGVLGVEEAPFKQRNL